VVKITDRDRSALRWISDQYAARVDTLAWVLGRLRGEQDRLGDKTVWRLVDRWRRAGLAERQSVIMGEPAWVTTTASARALVGSPWAHWRMSASQLAHVHAVGEVRELIHRRRADVHWVCERELRSTQARKGRHGEHLADGLVILPNDKRIAIEVELTAKTHERTQRIIDGLVGHEALDAVWYFVADRARRPVMAAAANHPAVLVHDLGGVRIDEE